MEKSLSSSTSTQYKWPAISVHVYTSLLGVVNSGNLWYFGHILNHSKPVAKDSPPPLIP